MPPSFSAPNRISSASGFLMLLDDAGERPGAELVVVAPLGQPFIGLRRQLDGDVAVAELSLELEHELLHHLEITSGVSWRRR